MKRTENYKEIKTKLGRFLTNRDDICFSYIFGSSVKNERRPLSDLDIAVYFLEKESGEDIFKRRLRLIHQFYQLLKTERIDLIVLNNCPLVLSYKILKSGHILSENQPEKRIDFFEKIIRQYLDFYPVLKDRSRIIQRKMVEGTYFD